MTSNKITIALNTDEYNKALTIQKALESSFNKPIPLDVVFKFALLFEYEKCHIEGFIKC